MAKLQVFILVAALLLCFVRAQDSLAQLPPCAAQCVVDYFPISGCNATDIACTCTSQPFQQALTQCVVSTCKVRDQLAAQNISTTTCHVPVKEYDGFSLMGASIGFAVASFWFVFIRAFVKWRTQGFDDYFCVLAWCTALVLSVLLSMTDQLGLFRPIYTVPVDDISRILFYFYLGRPLCTISLALSRLCVCFFLLRIFPSKYFKWYMYSIIVFKSILCVVLVVFQTVQCTPVNFAWLQWLGEIDGKCVGVEARIWLESLGSIIPDLMILAAPLVQLHQIQKFCPTKQKLQAMVMFSVGAVATALGIVRSIVSLKIGGALEASTGGIIAILLVIELHLTVICACMPAVRIWFNQFIATTVTKWSPSTWSQSTSTTPVVLYEIGAKGNIIASSAEVQSREDAKYMTSSMQADRNSFVRLKSSPAPIL